MLAPAYADAPVSAVTESVEVISAPVVELPMETVDISTSSAPAVEEAPESVEPITTPVVEPETVPTVPVEVPVTSEPLPPVEEVVTVTEPIEEVPAVEVIPEVTESSIQDLIKAEALTLFKAAYPEAEMGVVFHHFASQVVCDGVTQDNFICIASVISPGLVHVYV